VPLSRTTAVFAQRAAVLAVLAALWCPVYSLRADEVYKSVDAQGHVVYSDRGSTSTARKAVIHVDQPDPAEVARNAREQAILKVEDSQRKQAESVENHGKALEERKKQVRCENARNSYNSVKDAARMFKLDAQGNRTYYTDVEADARREELRKAMTSACGS
jgi:uncharacterized protein DUF4124